MGLRECRGSSNFAQIQMESLRFMLGQCASGKQYSYISMCSRLFLRSAVYNNHRGNLTAGCSFWPNKVFINRINRYKPNEARENCHAS